jgi:hypothetical protein
MRPLNRPMFKYGGPIKEGIMTGMKEKQAINTVGSPLAPKDETGRGGYAFPIIPALYGATMAGIRALPTVYRGIRTASKFSPSQSGGFFRNLFPTGRFTNVRPTITRSKTPTIDTKGADYSPIVINQGKRLGVFQSLKDPTRLGQAIRENPFTAGTIGIGAAGQIKNIPDIASGAVGLAADTGLGIANYILGTDFKRGKKDPEATGDAVAIERLDKNKTVASGDTGGGDPNTSAKTDAEKQKINEDRIQETKNKYYKLMGIDKMNKEAVYDSLIDASKVIQAEGGDLKGAIKSGSLQSQLISAISKNLDKSADLKKKIDQAVLSAEIQKDINKTKMSDFDKQLAILGPEGYRKKALGETSVADMIAATKAKGTLVNSDIVSSFIESKGGKVTDTFDDTKFQKWEKNNSGKDEIDYITENFSTIDPGVYVVNGRAVQIGIGEDGKKTANYVDLSTIIG